MWFIKHFGGMGSAEKDLPSDIWPLDLDNEDKKHMITTLQMAKDLINEF